MPEDPVQILSSVLVVDTLLLAVTILCFWAGVFVARRLFGSEAGYGLGSLGITRPKTGYLAGAGIGFLVGTGAFVVSIAINLLTILILEQYGYPTDSNPQEPLQQGVQGWVGESPWTAIPVAFAVIAVFGPAVEEFLFRGALFGGLYKLITLISGRLGGRAKGDPGKSVSGRGPGIAFALAGLASSVAFAYLHAAPAFFPALLILALALCVLYQRTGSLLPNFVAHATFNSIVVLLLILSGLAL